MKTQSKKNLFLKSIFLIATFVVFGFTSSMAQTDTTRKPATTYPQTEPMNPNQTSPTQTQPMNPNTPQAQPATPNRTYPQTEPMNPNAPQTQPATPNKTTPSQTTPAKSNLTDAQIKKIVGNDAKTGVDAQGNQLYKDSSGRIYYLDADGNKVYKK
jgi:hypothetical protein